MFVYENMVCVCVCIWKIEILSYIQKWVCECANTKEKRERGNGCVLCI